MLLREGSGMTEEVEREIEEVNLRIDELDDPRACYAMIRERIRKHRLAGESIPEDLQRLERAMLAECLAESQGR